MTKYAETILKPKCKTTQRCFFLKQLLLQLLIIISKNNIFNYYMYTIQARFCPYYKLRALVLYHAVFSVGQTSSEVCQPWIHMQTFIALLSMSVSSDARLAKHRE